MEKFVIASVRLSAVTGEELLTVLASDFDPYVTLTVRQHSVNLTRDQARQAADALRSCALTATDATFGKNRRHSVNTICGHGPQTGDPMSTHSVSSGATVAGSTHSLVDVVATALVGSWFDFAGTPCGVLAPLLDGLAGRGASLTYLHREDVAVAFAVGVNLAGGHLCVFMQNSGFGQSVNVLASLVEPFRAQVPMIVSMRGTGVDTTPENRGMGRTTIPVLHALGIPFRRLSVEHPTADITWLSSQTRNTGGPAAVLVEPGYFGWSSQ
jgi:sulfopyruvate decarboxylase TPP-binding subunit